MIWIDGMSKSFSDGKELFDKVSLLIPSDITVGILGQPGVGKSTLLKMIAGTELVSKGKIECDGSLIWGGSFNTAMNGQMTLFPTPDCPKIPTVISDGIKSETLLNNSLPSEKYLDIPSIQIID